VVGTCDSCGRDGEGLTAVHRLYVTPEAWDTPGKVTKVPDVERWCVSCLTHYPHEEVGDA